MPFSQPSYQQTTTTNLSDAQKSYQDAAAKFLQSQMGVTSAAYPGQMTSGLTPDQGTAIGQLGSLGMYSTGPQVAGLNTLGNVAAGNYLYDPFTANYLRSTADYARQQFWNQDIPQIQAPFIAAGQSGPSTPMVNAESQAAGQFETGLANTLLQQGLGQYNQAFQNMQNAAGAIIPLGQQVSTTGLQAMSAPQQVNQSALSSNYQDWLRQMGNPWQAVSGGSGLVTQPQGYTSPPLYGQSPFSQLTSGISSLVGPFAMLRFAGLI